MSYILHIETSSSGCSAAVSDDDRLLGFKSIDTGLSHAAKITILIREVMQMSEIDFNQLSAVAVSRGPGSYTGLRIGVSAAKGICYALNIPLLSVVSLQIMAARVLVQYLKKNNMPAGFLCPMLDARRMEVYSAVYDSALAPVREIIAEVIDINSYSNWPAGERIYFFGPGAEKCRTIISHPSAVFLEGVTPLAQDMPVLVAPLFYKGQYEDTGYFEPYYLKDFIATIPRKNIIGHK